MSIDILKREQYKFMNPMACFCFETRGCTRHSYIGDVTITLNTIQTKD